MDAVPIHCLRCRARVARSRGCCNRCLGRHRRAVAAGETSWGALESRALVLPAQQRGRAWRRFTVG